MHLRVIKGIARILLCIILLLSSIGCEQAVISMEPIDLIVNEELASANRKFSFDMLRVLDEEEGEHNLFFSPLSISLTLSMVANGAVGETKNEMLRALSYQDLDLEGINASYAGYQQYLDQNLGPTELFLKNSIWLREDESIKDEYLSIINDDYSAQYEYLDFSEPDAAHEINDWIEKATKGKIKDMLSPPLPADTVLYLINAIYFKGDWAEQFEEDQTIESEFYTQSGDVNSVQMMTGERTNWYLEDEMFQAVRLPYVDENRSMIVLLPSEDSSIREMIGYLDEVQFMNIIDRFYLVEDLILQIPKFQMEYGSKKLNQALQNLGMETAFTSSANFSGIREGLFISRFMHKAFIQVNETGSEAAAVTVGEMACEERIEPLRFRADRPFLFIIYDEEAESILFLGKYCE